MKRTVVAGTDEHRKLIEDGWKPISAYQTFNHKKLVNKGGSVRGHDLKPVSRLQILMERNNASS